MKRKSIAVFCIVSLLWFQLACGGGDAGGGSARGAPHFKPGFNLFSPEQDIEIGRRSALEVAQQVPLLRDEAIVNYVRGLGAKLAAHAPGYKFTYQFNVIATRDINAFALPGGYIFVNAGTIAAAKNEGELAGVIAHEVTHVALRHGTNQASKAYVAKAGIDILRSLAGGQPDLDQAISTIGGMGANMVFLKFGRTAERQADLEGARIMAEAGYHPRDMAGFFQTIQEKGGQRAPEFLSDHPDPGNRIASINEVLPSLRVSANAVRDSNEFQQAKARLTGGQSTTALKSSDEMARKGPADPNNAQAGARPENPAAAFKQFQSRDGLFALSYPQNWDALVADDTNMIFAPKGAYGQTGEGLLVTHGIFIGAVAPEANDLEAATAAFVNQQLQLNPDFRLVRRPQSINFGGRAAYATVVAGPSPVTGVVEIDVIYTTATSDGRLFYLITMAPEDEMQKYQATFDQIIASVRLSR